MYRRYKLVAKIYVVQLNILHEILFGKQKQASVQNDAVTRIIASSMHSIYGDSFFDSSATMCEGIVKFLQDAVDNGLKPNDKIVMMLIAGEDSVRRLNNEGPKLIMDDQPSPDSPKHYFRVAMMGDMSGPGSGMDVGNFEEKMNPPQEPIEKPSGVDTSISYNKDATYADIVKELVAEYAPLAPESAKAELSNDTECALFAMSKLIDQ